MNVRLLASCGFVCAALLLSGCDDGRQSPGKVLVRVANVAPGFEDLTFRREQDARGEALLPFKGAQEFTYDIDVYDFFVLDREPFDASLQRRTWTFAPQLDGGRSYLFALTEVGTEVQPVVIGIPDAPATETQFLGLHAAAGIPALDLYLERPGVGIAGATPRGSFNVQEQIAPRTLPSGDYELTLTAAGDPSSVLLTTTTITLPADTHTSFIVVAESGQGSAPFSVLALQGPVAATFYDRNATSELSVVNGATDRAPRDLMVNGEFSPPLFSAMPFGQPTAYAPVPVDPATRINVTPVGNPGVLELDLTYFGNRGQRATLLFAGPAGTLTAAIVPDDRRRLNSEAKLRAMNAASQFIGGLDFAVTAPGGDHLLVPPFASLLAPGISGDTLLPPGEYDLYLRQFFTATVVSGPTRITLGAGGLYGVLAVDGPDTATADVILLDDFP
jgi:hypothetical protein